MGARVQGWRCVHVRVLQPLSRGCVAVLCKFYSCANAFYKGLLMNDALRCCCGFAGALQRSVGLLKLTLVCRCD